jgi:hypothetical protein
MQYFLTGSGLLLGQNNLLSGVAALLLRIQAYRQTGALA